MELGGFMLVGKWVQLLVWISPAGAYECTPERSWVTRGEGNVPINSNNLRTKRKSRRMLLILRPDRPAVNRSVEVIIKTESHDEDPGEEREESVDEEGASVVAFAFGEGVHWVVMREVSW